MELDVTFANGFCRKVNFLIDTGAEVSLIRPDLVPAGCDVSASNAIRLVMVNNEPFRGGDKSCKVDLRFFGEELGREFPLVRERHFSTELYIGAIQVQGILAYSWLLENRLGVIPHRDCLLWDIEGPEWLTGTPPMEEHEDEPGISTMRMGAPSLPRSQKFSKFRQVDQISMSELEKILLSERWTPPILPPESQYSSIFPQEMRLERKFAYIREISRYVKKVDEDSKEEIGVEEWEEIAEYLVRSDEEEYAKEHCVQKEIVRVNTVIESEPIQDDYLEFLRSQMRNRYKNTTFRPDVYSDPPVRGPHGLAKIEMKPGIVPHIQRPFAITGERREAMIEIISEFERLGLIEPGVSPWLSPAFPVKKKEAGKWRLVVDYRALNAGMVPDSFPLPIIDEVLARQGQFKIWSVLDMKAGYHQVPLDPKSRPLTCMSTPKGPRQWKVVPMGIINGNAIYQRMMEWELDEFDFADSYVDDVIIGSNGATQEEAIANHILDLTQILDKFEKDKLVVNGSKAHMFTDSVEWCGHVLSRGTRSPAPKKLMSIQKWELPFTITALRGFLGLKTF